MPIGFVEIFYGLVEKKKYQATLTCKIHLQNSRYHPIQGCNVNQSVEK